MKNLINAVAILLIALLALLFYLPIFKDISHGIPSVDWCGIYPYIDFFRISLFQFHQFPLRAPHFNGGYPSIGFPYDISLSPLSLIVLAFGGIEGTKITVFLIVLCGALSVFYLTRRLLRYNLPGSFFSSAAFLFCSWGPCQYLESNYEKVYFYFLPLLLVLFIKSIKDKKFIFFASVIFSIVVVSAGAIVIPIALFLFLFACLNIIQFEKPRTLKVNTRYPAVLLLIMLVTFFISMAKILPMRQLLARKDIQFIHFSHENNYPDIARTLMTTERDVTPKKLYDWLLKTDSYIVGTEKDDYVQMYFGLIPVLLALLACIYYWKEIWRYLVLLAVSVVIALGPHSPVDLFRWLWHLHPYAHSIWRLDEYFTFQIFFLIAVISGKFFSVLDLKEGRRFLWLLILVTVFSLNNMFWPNRRFLENRIHLRDKSEFSFRKGFFQVAIKNYIGAPEPYQVDQQYYLQSNIGLLDWLFGNLAIKTSVIPKYLVRDDDSQYLPSQLDKLELNPSYRGEVFCAAGENKAELRYFSPNRIKVTAQIKSPGEVVINQNYHESWRTDAGKLCDWQGLLAVCFDKPGDYMIRLTYVPREFYRGLAISILSLLSAFYFLVYRHAKPKT
jgi:hypothetical protein